MLDWQSYVSSGAQGWSLRGASTGNRPARARFGRKRTHNEELCVTSCGVIVGRATFYGSEAPNGVRVSITIYYLRITTDPPAGIPYAPFSNEVVFTKGHLA